MPAPKSNTADREPPFVRFLLTLLFGPLVWALHFTILYAAHSLLCPAETAGNVSAGVVSMRIVSAVATVPALIVLAANIARGPDGVYRQISIALSTLAMFGILLTAISVLLVSACASIR